MVSVPAQRVWLEVPFDEKERAKAHGARWDRAEKRWYARPGTAQPQRWLALPEVLPHEDRRFGSGLFVDLVPSSCWFTNVRSCVDERDWFRLRKMVYRRAGNQCETCAAGSDPTQQLWLEAHERWEYDTTARVQRLRRIMCLCTRCHEVTHFGLAALRGRGKQALEHLMTVRGWSRQTATRHVDDAFALWASRSAVDWSLDVSVLADAGIRVLQPPASAVRRQFATTTLAAEIGQRLE